MSTNKQRLLGRMAALALFGAVTLGAAPAGAAPTVREAGFRMVTRTPPELRSAIARARAVDATSFARVTELVARAPEANARARARRAPLALYIARLGPSALLPTLELLAVDPPRGVPADAAPEIRRDLIEATGLLRDARALPVLAAILADPAEDAETTRTTAEAVARVGGAEASAHLLSALGKSGGERARAILAGMGECRRVEIADALADHLRTASDDATARVTARSLGRTGNAWAWRARADRSEEARVRETAARALVQSFVQRSGEARTAAANALLVVDAPETPALLAEARRAASPETAAALDALAARYARSPLHR